MAAKKKPTKDDYQRKLEDSRRRSREKSDAGFDIGEIPPVKNRRRRKGCERNLQRFLETYFPHRFFLAFSDDQRDIIKKTETILIDGGTEAFAIYRGGGKTTICEGSAVWAIVYGHRKFIPIIGATGPAATEILDSIQLELETNDLLYEDFPEAIHPIRALGGEARKCKRQSYKGERTRIEWGADGVVFATIPGKPCSGAILRTAGIEGRLRGMKHGMTRPDAVLLDDIQTDESAASPPGIAKRLRIVKRTVLKMAGAKKRIACMLPCTIIFPGDLADQLTDRQKSPEWNGERRRLVHQFPTNKTWWDQYREVRADGMRRGDNGQAARELYLREQAIADEGAIVAWPEYTKGKASAIQYIMDEFIDDPDGAAAELNNEPRHAAALTNLRQLSEEDLAVHQNTLPLGIVPRDCNKLTAFIDLGQEVLYWMICAWSDSFGGAIIDYGAFPEQPMQIFEAASVPRPLSALYPALDEKARIYRALHELTQILSGKAYAQQNGTGRLTISLGMIDSGKWTDTVHEFLGRSPFRALWRASKGRAIDPGSKPLNEYRKEGADEVGWNWRIDAKTTAKGRFVSFDTRPWKTQVVNSLIASPGSATCIYLPGERLVEHPMIALHLLSEYRDEVTSAITGRSVEAWKARPDKKENHYWDCLIGCAVAASVAGLKFSSAMAAGETPQPEAKKKRLKLSDLYAKSRG